MNKRDFLERPETIRLLWRLLYITCGLTVVAELFVHRHGLFGFDGFFGFYAILGFFSCLALILIAKLGGLFLKRSPDYWDRDEEGRQG